MILILGLDGLDPDVFELLRERGDLPHLGEMARAGLRGRLRSTFPPVSVPAWSTFLTGVGPAVHGLYDFTVLEEGRVRFQNGADRRVPTFLELLDAAGRRTASVGVPTTYPVCPLRHGAMLAGFDSPFSGAPDASAMYPPELWRRMRADGLDLRPSTLSEDRKGASWHATAAERILASVERRRDQALWLLREQRWDLLVVHFQASDTAGHHFFRYFDPASPRHDASFPERTRVISQVYASLDRAVGRLRRAAGDDALCVVLSDHGMGPASDRVIHLNRWLEEEGLLVRRSGGASRLAAVARGAALRWLPPPIQAALFRRLRGGAVAGVETLLRLGEIDRERSVAFSEESSTLPGIWLLDPSRRDAVVRRLRAWPAVRRVHRREDLYRGPERRRAPHLLVELRHGLVRTPPGYSGASCRQLATHELDGVRGGGLNGVHRPDGVLLAAGGPIKAASEVSGAWIGDLAPSFLAAMDVPIPDWMEGRPLADLAPAPRFVSEPPAAPPSVAGGRPAAPLSAAQTRLLEDRLRALGYLG